MKIQGVVLIDSPFPSAPPLLSDTLIERLLRDQEHALDSSMTALVVRQFKQSTTLLGRYTPSARDAKVSLAFLYCTAGFCPDEMEDVHPWFRERDDAGRDRGWIVEPWQALIGGTVPVWDVPGHHFEPFSSVHVSRSLVSCECDTDMCRSRRRRYSLIVHADTWRRPRGSLSYSFLFLFFLFAGSTLYHDIRCRSSVVHFFFFLSFLCGMESFYIARCIHGIDHCIR